MCPYFPLKMSLGRTMLKSIFSLPFCVQNATMLFLLTILCRKCENEGSYLKTLPIGMGEGKMHISQKLRGIIMKKL